MIDLCTYADCFVSPDRHNECAARKITPCWGRLGHQHVPKRSQTPRDERQCPVMLCLGHSDNIDNGTRYEGLRLSNRVVMGTYFIEDRDTGEILLELEVKE